MRQIPDEDVQEIIVELETASEVYARAKAQCEGLKEDRKQTKHQLMAVAEAEGVRTITKQEVYAYSHPNYRDVVKRMVKAIEDETLAQYRCKIAEIRFEAWRTINANQRALTR